MWSSVFAFVAGIWLCQQLADLPDWSQWLYYIACLIVVSILLLKFDNQRRFLKPLWSFALAFFYAAMFGQWQLSQRLPADLIKQDLQVTGVVIGLPRQHGKNLFFDFQVESATHDGEAVDFAGKVSLVWYRNKITPLPGQRWQMSIRLKPPVSTLNHGLYDRERRLFADGYRAVGYVRDKQLYQYREDSIWTGRIDAMRFLIQQRLQAIASNQAMATLRALVIGDKSAIDQDSWTLFRQAGINHLVAISGLHISLISLLFYGLTGVVWRASAFFCQWLPAPKAQAAVAIVAALFYAALAGFALPTQRAVIMIAVVLTYRLLSIKQSLNLQLALALIIVLLFSPIAVIDVSFWLSFLAVFAIVFSLQGYLRLNRWQNLIWLQFSIAIMLLPLQMLTFGELSLIGPVVNLVLIPVFSFIYVPLGLLLSVLITLPMQSSWLVAAMNLYLGSLEMVFLLIKQAVDFAGGNLQMPQLNWQHGILLSISVLLFFLPYRRLFKLIAMLLVIVVLQRPPVLQRDDSLYLSLLDVGQGLAVLLKSGDNTLIYDLGPAFGGKNATRSVVMPMLKNSAVEQLHTVIISHSDKDHAGDFRSLLQSYPVKQVFSGEPGKLNSRLPIKHCRQGDRWRWQQTQFEFLNPAYSGKGNNNASCVLLIRQGRTAILLTGDIEASMEKQLMQQIADLQAAIVVIPHHGSHSSSTPAFVDRVNPEIVLNSSGYLNRYKFPHDQVLQRWTSHSSIFLDTAKVGQIHLEIAAGGSILDLYGERQRNRRYWYWQRNR